MLKVPEGEPRPGTRDVRAALGLDETGRSAGHRLRRFVPWAVAILAIAGGAGAYLFWGGGGERVVYTTEPVHRGALTVKVSATGSVQPTNQVDVSSELSGTVRSVNVDYNSPVRAGDVLAELDTDKLAATVENNRAKLKVAEASVAEAAATVAEKQAMLARAKSLSDRQVTSRQEYESAKAAADRAEAALESARAQIDVARAELTISEANLAKAKIVSPIGGVVLTRSVDPGATVAASLQAPVLFTIAEDLKEMELQVDVDEADVGQLAVGQKATFTVDAYPERTFPADIRTIRYAPETVQGVVTYKAVLNVDNADLLLRPGMTATADIVVEEVPDALLVPNAALRYAPPQTADQGSSRTFLQRLMPMPSFRAPARPDSTTGSERTVWVLRDGAPAAVPVSVGATDGRETEITKGALEPAERVIVDSANQG
ncbi:efflux RND transporter periplasmic adaptor subunit [Propylenella binzhouense]|uniref:Efflux RND transporter periplasmic adaptor subunit n=1 Tax=Propylenella binzhouense TaxID=2555902 RepID=A0A964WUX1_9HYPH|nr:efflux RND transporter periplasmic adaptor subunit [Propylenella binzhouense]MYZ49458.1 efflux RND transporter periplasmic adaptor subunit [Propylenella binzhouense]